MNFKNLAQCGDMGIYMYVSSVLECEEKCLKEPKCFKYVIQRFPEIKNTFRCHLKNESLCSPKDPIEQHRAEFQGVDGN